MVIFYLYFLFCNVTIKMNITAGHNLLYKLFHYWTLRSS